MGDYYTEIFGKAPKAGTVIPGEGTVLKEVVITPKRPRKYRFDRRVSTIGPGHDVISETLYDEYSDGQYMGDLSGVAGQRTIYVTPFGNDTIYGRTRNWQGGEPNRLLETGTGFMEVAPDRKDQTRRKRQFQTNLKSSHVSPNSSKDEKNAYKRAIKEKQKGGDLSKPRLISKQQNKQFKPEFVPKQDQATKDSIAVNRYNDQEVQATKPGNYKQKNGKTVWVPDRTKYPYKKQMGGSLNEVPFYQEGTSKEGIIKSIYKNPQIEYYENVNGRNPMWYRFAYPNQNYILSDNDLGKPGEGVVFVSDEKVPGSYLGGTHGGWNPTTRKSRFVTPRKFIGSQYNTWEAYADSIRNANGFKPAKNRK